MRLRAALLFAIVAIATPAIAQQVSPADDAQIREVVRKYMAARELQDPKAVEALFTADADQLVSSGEWRRGRPDIVKGTLASTRNSGGTRTITIETIRQIAPTVALADGRYELAGLAGGSTRSMWSSFTMVRGSDGWQIAAIRNMLPAPPVPAAAPNPPTPPTPPKPPQP